MENQYLDYFSFKKTNEKLLEYLNNNNSLVIARFKYIFLVIDHLYDKRVNKKEELDKPEEEMFEVGYQYLFDRFNTINMLLEHNFHKDYDELNAFGKEINMMFYIEDFIDEVDSADGNHEKDHDKLYKLEEDVLEHIEKRQHIQDEMLMVIDDKCLVIFDSLGLEYYGVPDIFYDIAINLELIDEEDEYLDIDDIINEQVS